MQNFRTALFLVMCIALSACKTELYSSLPEGQANAMMALLIANGIEAEKGPAAKGLVPLSVPTSELSNAIKLLQDNGYPKDEFDSLGTVFEQKGLVASPLEERVRFIYGLSQTLSETLNQIDGVVAARVHIVLAETDALSSKTSKSTASVFLKTSPGIDLSNKVPDIKQLVRASVQDLDYEDVVVTLFESEPIRETMAAAVTPNGVNAVRDDNAGGVSSPVVIIGIGGLVLLLCGGGAFVFWLRKKRARGVTPAQDRAASSAGELEAAAAVVEDA